MKRKAVPKSHRSCPWRTAFGGLPRAVVATMWALLLHVGHADQDKFTESLGPIFENKQFVPDPKRCGSIKVQGQQKKIPKNGIYSQKCRLRIVRDPDGAIVTRQTECTKLEFVRCQ